MWSAVQVDAEEVDMNLKRFSGDSTIQNVRLDDGFVTLLWQDYETDFTCNHKFVSM